MKTKTHTHLRWLTRRDMPMIMDIENESFDDPWSEEEFLKCLRKSNGAGMVAEVKKEVVGYMVYELQQSEIKLLSFAVHPKHRRGGAGRALLERLICKLDASKRNRISVVVRERNLEAQLFLRNIGFLCTQVLNNYYDNVTEDAYMMEYFIGSI